MRLEIFDDFDDQALVSFTGKLNILRKQDSGFVGEIIFLDGEVVNANYQKIDGFKALMKLCVLSSDGENFRKVVEPELILPSQRKISIPLGALKRKINDIYDKYIDAEKYRPPGNMKLLPRAEVISSNIDITPQEYSLLCTLSDYNMVDDVYTYNEMLDFEITQALVNLRKKEILKVIKLV